MNKPIQPHIRALRLRKSKARWYSLAIRISDGFSGRLDAKAELARDMGEGKQPTHSLGRLKAENDERCELEYRAAVTTAVTLIDQIRILSHKIAALEAEVAESRKLLDSERLLAESEPLFTHSTESHLTQNVIARRRERERAGRLIPIENKIRQMESKLIQDRALRAESRGQLETLWEGTRSRVFAIADFYERRANTQSRAYLRHTPPKVEGQHPLLDRIPISAPDWAFEPNPWLPIADSPANTEKEQDD